MDLRVVVVGSGPAGAYAAEALTRDLDGVLVDVVDVLPTPFGLVRYGVAPDHPKTQTISTSLAKVLEHPHVRFLGNVRVGTDVSLAELQEHFDAVVFATGAAVDRRMDIPGEDLPGSFSATEFVAWYCGHPFAALDGFVLDSRTAVVVGAGNVAGDVARMLARTSDELRPTDAPDHVLRAFGGSRIRDVHLVARRGPAQTRFTTRELRELGEMSDADVVVDPADLELSEHDRETMAAEPATRRNVEVLQSWAGRAPSGRPRRVHMHFFRRPVEVLGDDRVTGIRLERTAVDADGRAVGTGETEDLAAEMVLRAVGYRGIPVAGLPFDEARGIVPHEAGRVHLNGAVVPGIYVAGWAKRGPTGVIGTNKHDARETVRSLADDVPGLARAPVRAPDALLRLLAERGVDVVRWDGWLAIDAAEVDRGREQGRARSKVADLETLLRLGLPGRG
ncbi:MAG: FAD-dependent oxidoreductase [Actinomycetes bacterium]